MTPYDIQDSSQMKTHLEKPWQLLSALYSTEQLVTSPVNETLIATSGVLMVKSLSLMPTWSQQERGHPLYIQLNSWWFGNAWLVGALALSEYWEFMFYIKISKTSQGRQETIKDAERLYNCFCILKKKALSFSNYEKENIKLRQWSQSNISTTNWHPIEHRLVITLKSRCIIWKQS